MRLTPRYLTVVVHNTTPQQLSALLLALDPDTNLTAQSIQIQLSQNDNAATVLYIGNSDLNIATPNYGVVLTPDQSHIIQSLSSNLMRLDEIYLAISGATDQKVNVTIVTR